MLTFKQFIQENTSERDAANADIAKHRELIQHQFEPHQINKMKKHLVPAYHHNGKTYIGKKGEGHTDVIDSHPEIKHLEDNASHGERGYYHTVDQKYHPAEHFLKHKGGAGRGLESLDLMTTHQTSKWAERQRNRADPEKVKHALANRPDRHLYGENKQ